jgi:ATP-dependent protease ClpP protease subunit
MKKLVIFLIIALFMAGCAGTDIRQEPIQHELKITIEQTGSSEATVRVEAGEDNLQRIMEVDDPGMTLSQLSAIAGGELYVKLFSGLSTADVTRFWNDLIYLETETLIKVVNLFIDSPGGDAFSGLALADQIEKYQKKGFTFIAHGTGIIASAAVPIFAVCDETHATQATIFMVHEAALWKWPGRESASTIRAQTRLMDLLQELYLNKMVANSNLTFDQWVILESKTSWFGATEAKNMGILDIIDN